jgi:uncharacterized protein
VPALPASGQFTSVSPPSIPRRGVWGAWPTIGLGTAILAIFLIAQTVVAIFFAVATLLGESNIGDEAISALSNDGLLISLAVIISALAGGGFILLFIHLRHGPSIVDYLGLKPLRGKAFLGLLAVFLGLIGLTILLDSVAGSPQDAGFTTTAYETSRWPALLGVALVIFAPLFEEAFFRGFVFVGLQNSRLGGAGVVLITSLAWAALHIQYDLYGMVSILILGIVFGTVRLKTGSLWSTLFLHSLWNLTALVLTAVSV